MSLQLPVVATDVGAVREAVADQETGYVVRSRDPGAIASVTVRLVDDFALRKRFGDAGRGRAQQLYSAESCAGQHMAAFDHAIDHRRRRRVGSG